jgi:thiamine pyrophosphate-dependent acetolactate synthase large subunit-like protein
VVVDIDPAELGKVAAFGKPLDMAIESDAKAFIGALDSRLGGWPRLDIGPCSAASTTGGGATPPCAWTRRPRPWTPMP